MTSQDSDGDSDAGPLRFEATVHPGQGIVALDRVADLDLDRLPDGAGQVRVLVDAAELAALLDQGYEVRLQRTVAVRPIDPALVSADQDVTAWLDEQLDGVPGEGS